MSTENEDPCLLAKPEFDEAAQKRSKITYARDFLLSFTELKICKDLPSGVDLSNLWQSRISYTRDFLLSKRESEVCKRLPGGFNPSVLCEFDDDTQKLPSNLLSHNSWGSQSGSSSSSRCDSGNYSRGSGRKQESHSSGWNKASHSQHNRDSDNGSGYGGHSQQITTTGGLLGRGTSPIQFQCIAGALAPKVQANVPYQLSKSDNPYRPPHSQKAEAGRETNLGRTEKIQICIAMEGNGRTDKSQTLEPNSGIDVMKGFESDELSLCLKRGSVHTDSGPVISEPGGFPFSVANDSFLTSTADEYQSTGTNFEGIRAARFSEIIELDNTERNESSLDDDWEEIVSMLRREQELRLSAIVGREQMYDPTVQICLPDEDSLITIDDLLIPQKPPNLQREKRAESAFEYGLPDEESLIAFDDLIIPRHSLSASRGNSIKDNFPPSKVPVDILEKLRAQNSVHCDARSTLPGYYGAMSLGNSYHNQQFEQSYTEFFHSQINPGVHALYSHHTQINSQTKFISPKTSCGTPPLKQHFNAPTCCSSKAKPERPDPSVCCSMLRKPVVFPHYQQNELLRGPVLANYMTQLTSHAQGINPTPILPSNCQQTSYEGFRLPTPVRGVSYRDAVLLPQQIFQFGKTNCKRSEAKLP